MYSPLNVAQDCHCQAVPVDEDKLRDVLVLFITLAPGAPAILPATELACGVTDAEASEGLLTPAAFVAVTVNV
jgi:hypothetical protein